MELTDLLIQFAVKYPWLMSMLLILGTLRAVFKPLVGLADAYVLATPSKEDDKKLEGFKAGKVYKSLVWFVDFFASIKLPKK